MTREHKDRTTLCIDLGGTKTLLALVRGCNILERIERPTPRAAPTDEWIETVVREARPWNGQYQSVGMAVSGLVCDGNWSALNKATLDVDDSYPLEARLRESLRCPAFAVNDAQAAAWGEYQNGTSSSADMVYLTISTGLGGGIVVNGELIEGRNGLAGHVGQWTSDNTQRPGPLENHVTGRWIAAEAARQGHSMEAAGVFAASAQGDEWAEAIISESARRAALLSQNIQMMLAPEYIVIGGGIGLAAGYLDRMRRHCADLNAHQLPNFLPAALGRDAGIVGVADLTTRNRKPPTGRKS